mgnify:CR=1 FL=1
MASVTHGSRSDTHAPIAVPPELQTFLMWTGFVSFCTSENVVCLPMKVLLTGAGTGLGRRVGALLAARGATVVAADAAVPTLEELRDVDVAVHLSAGDHDALAARGATALSGLTGFLEGLTKFGVEDRKSTR